MIKKVNFRREHERGCLAVCYQKESYRRPEIPKEGLLHYNLITIIYIPHRVDKVRNTSFINIRYFVCDA